MFAAAAHRLLLCLTLLIATLCVQPRGLKGLALPDVAASMADAMHGDSGSEDTAGDPAPADTPALVAMPDLTDDTHAAVLWSWAPCPQSHTLVQSTPVPRHDAHAGPLLRPPSA
jgi:hypothetical protein